MTQTFAGVVRNRSFAPAIVFLFFCLVDPAAAQSPSTWNVIQRKILDKQCISCHVAGSSFAQQSGLVLTAESSYEQLVDVPPKNAQAYKDSLMRVSSKGSFLGVAKSFLWEKIDASQQAHYNNDHPYYGAMMPLGGNFLTKGELKLINEWIYAGAPKHGIVADSTVLNDTSRHTLPLFAPLPKPASGMQFHVGPFTVRPNAAVDREFFYFVPLTHSQDLFVNRTEITMRPGSHHFLLYTFSPNTPPSLIPSANTYRDLRDSNGVTNNSLFFQMFYHVFFAGTQTPYMNYYFPKGVALRLPANTGFDLNSHYVNRTGSPITGEVYANLYTVPKEEVQRVAEVLDLQNTAIELPPMQTTQLTKTFYFPQQRHIFQLFSHAHERLTEFRVEVTGGPHNGKTVYWTNDWEHPPILHLDPPLTLNAGEGLKAIATYTNNTANTIRFGLQSTDEMMIIFGAYYTGELLTSAPPPSAPAHFALRQNYPNPFNPETAVTFSLPEESYVTLTIFDPVGREIATVVNERRTAGSHTVHWNGEGHASGIYFYRLQAGAFSAVKKMLLLR